MINDVPVKYIPDRNPWLAPATDISSYSDIWQAVDAIWQECLIDDQSLGWAISGKRYFSAIVKLLENSADCNIVRTGVSSALAVLVFGTNSPIDQEIPYGVHPLAIQNLTNGGTVSIAEE